MRNISRFVVLFLMFTLLSAGCKEEVLTKETIRPVRAMKVGSVDKLIERWFPGRAKATREVDLSFRVAGPLITFSADIGDEVKEGQVLARIDPRDFEVNLRNVEGQLAKVEAAQKRAQSDYNRVVRIQNQDPGAVSQIMIDQNFEAVESTKAEIKSLTATVETARDQLKYTYLKAPFDGIVVSTYVENYEYVQAKQSIVRIIDHSKIEMVVNIPETLIPYADDVEKIRVRFDTFPDRDIPARVKEISKEASLVTRTYPVTLIMDQPKDFKILPGMAGKATGKGGLPKDRTGIEIPLSAIFSPEDLDKSFAWVINKENNVVNRREVKTGELTNFGIKISHGLKPDEWIATAGVHYLREGQKVRILTD